ncbi:trace amine-associated receptor 13c-like [Menidia menidia]
MDGVELCFPELLNSSCRKITYPPSTTVLIFISLSSLSLFTVTLNLLVIISISHFRQLHTPTNLLLLSLAVSDFLVGLLILSQIMILDGCWYFGDLMCVLYCVLNMITIAASIGTMVLISADRYVAICDPLHYPTKVTSTRVSVCVCLCWISSLISVFVLMRENLKHLGEFKSCSGECVIYSGFIENVSDLILTFIAPVSTIICLYLRVFMVVLSQVRAMRSHITAASQQHSGKIIIKKSELKAAGTLGVVVVTFLSCIFPYYFVSITSESTSLNSPAVGFDIYLVYMNSLFNPLIYAFFYSWFRKSIKLILTFRLLKHGSRDFSFSS